MEKTIAQKGTVQVNTALNFRKSPMGEVIGSLPDGLEIDVLDTLTFHKVRVDDKIGYVSAKYVSVAEFESTENTNDVPMAEFKSMEYTHDALVGEPCIIDVDFKPSMDLICQYALDCDVQVYVTSSMRDLGEPIKGAIVKPASKSCHYIGHAIDMNVVHDGILYNSKALHPDKLIDAPVRVQQFINLVRNSKSLRWGGDFSESDPVHIDDDYYRNNAEKWEEKLLSRISAKI